MQWRPDLTALALGAIFTVALALRIGWVVATETVVPPLSDPQYYHATAQNLAEGRGYGMVVDERGFVSGDESEATAFWPPGYPFVLAGVYAVFGDDEGRGQWVNAIAGALIVVPVFFIGRRLTPRPPLRRAERGSDAPHPPTPSPLAERGSLVGLLAAGMIAVMPSLVYWTPALFSEPVFALGVATTLALALHAPAFDGRTAVAWGCAIGVALAVTALVRSQGLVLIVPVAVLLIPRVELRAALRAILPVVGASAIVLAPWTLRNAAVMGEPYVINNNLCYNLRASHAPYSTGGSVAPQDLWDERPGISFRERELFFDDVGCGRAWTYAREHPGREFELAFKRAGWLLRSDAAPAVDWAESLGRTPVRFGDADAYVLAGDAFWYPVLALAIVSLIAVPRTREVLALWSLLATWGAVHVVFHGEPRYHVPMTPALASLAAVTIVELARRIRAVG